MSFLKDNIQKKKVLSTKIENLFEDCYFDFQSVNPNLPNFDEAYLARLLTKIAVGSATVWWSLIELKDFIRLKSVATNIRNSKYEPSRTDPF